MKRESRRLAMSAIKRYKTNLEILNENMYRKETQLKPDSGLSVTKINH